jgi:hypothetical protein
VEVIKKGLAMDGDRGVHIKGEHLYQKDLWQVASVIAAFARDKTFDLVLTGLQSKDRGPDYGIWRGTGRNQAGGGCRADRALPSGGQ